MNSTVLIDYTEKCVPHWGLLILTSFVYDIAGVNWQRCAYSKVSRNAREMVPSQRWRLLGGCQPQRCCGKLFQKGLLALPRCM